MTAVLVLGASGLLGHSLVRELSSSFEVWGTTRQQVTASHPLQRWLHADRWIGGVAICDRAVLGDALRRSRAKIVLNCAGSVPQIAPSPEHLWRTNGYGPHVVAQTAADHGARLVHFSSDCVFSGAAGGYRETDPPDADEAYGVSKRLGEVVGEHCLTIRKSIIGFELQPGHGLLEWLVRRRGRSIDAYSTAFFSGMTTLALSRIIRDLLALDEAMTGLLHVAAARTSKGDLLRRLANELRLDIAVSSSTVVSCDRSLSADVLLTRTNIRPPSWDEMIEDLVLDLRSYAYRPEIERLSRVLG